MSIPPPPAPPPDDTSSASVGELFSDVARDLTELLRQEVELAKAEVQQSAKKAGRGAGMLAGAAMAADLTLVFLSVALWWALGDVMGRGWSGVVVAALWGVVALVLALKGRSELQRVRGVPDTVDTMKKIPQALKGQETSP